MATIGTKKTLRNGITVEITKVNPVTTFNAIKRELVKRGYELDSCRKATTGSRYLEMYSDDIYIYMFVALIILMQAKLLRLVLTAFPLKTRFTKYQLIFLQQR